MNLEHPAEKEQAKCPFCKARFKRYHDCKVKGKRMIRTLFIDESVPDDPLFGSRVTWCKEN